MAKEEAEEILNLFTQPGVEWIDKGNQRTQGYSLIAKKVIVKNLQK